MATLLGHRQTKETANRQAKPASAALRLFMHDCLLKHQIILGPDPLVPVDLPRQESAKILWLAADDLEADTHQTLAHAGILECFVRRAIHALCHRSGRALGSHDSGEAVQLDAGEA